jgi:hypothetical protein
MPALTYSVSDFVAYTKILSASVNAKFTDIRTLLNTTKLDDDNIQNAGITRATKLKLGTANHVLINDGTGAMSSEAALAASRGGTGQSSYTTGDVLYASGAAAISKLGIGTAGQFLKVGASSAPEWANLASSNLSYVLENLAVACSVGSGALTVALKGQNGSDPAGANEVKIGFRSATLTSGVFNVRSVTAALSVVISSGSTLGNRSAVAEYLYVYALDNAGTVELAVSGIRLDEGSLHSTTAEGALGAADSPSVLYSTTARTNVPIRLLARLQSTQATAGTWAAVPTEIALAGAKVDDGVRLWTGGHQADCIFSRTNTALGDFGTDTGTFVERLNVGFGVVTSNGVIAAVLPGTSGTVAPSVTFTPPKINAYYEVTAILKADSGQDNTQVAIALIDPAGNAIAEGHRVGMNGAPGTLTLRGFFYISSSSAQTVKLQGRASANTALLQANITYDSYVIEWCLRLMS